MQRTIRGGRLATVGLGGPVRVVRDGRVNVIAGGHAVVRDGGSATVLRRGEAEVHTGGCAIVNSGGYANVYRGGAADVLRGGLATVQTGGYARVGRGGRANVKSGGHADVLAGGRVVVQAGGHANVAQESTAFLLGWNAMATGAGRIVKLYEIDFFDPKEWAEALGAGLSEYGSILLHKALPDDLVSGRSYGHPTQWPVEGVVICEDFNENPHCGGGGLHLSPFIEDALSYRPDASRMLLCEARLDDIVPLGDIEDPAECKARRVRVLFETRLDGRALDFFDD